MMRTMIPCSMMPSLKTLLLVLVCLFAVMPVTNAGGSPMNLDKCLACVEQRCGYCHRTSPQESSHYASGSCVCSVKDYEFSAECNDMIFATDDYYKHKNYYQSYEQYYNRGGYNENYNYNGNNYNYNGGNGGGDDAYYDPQFDWIVTKTNTKIGCHVNAKSQPYKVVKGLSITILSAIGIFFGMAFLGWFIQHLQRRRSVWKAKRKQAALLVQRNDSDDSDNNNLKGEPPTMVDSNSVL